MTLALEVIVALEQDDERLANAVCMIFVADVIEVVPVSNDARLESETEFPELNAHPESVWSTRS